ncbi:MAG TPA: thymidine phosphorylase [Clostridiales bacterium]|nr:thymidine phosphorylase [Clostridiales bacterium]
MDIVELINKKKFGKRLTKDELSFFVSEICSKNISEAQIGSMLMAMFLKGLDFDETYNLTIEMARSGKILNLDDIGLCFDKHSTGGVSDTTTLVVVPILASLGVKVAKMSGRSLGWTGGTADKMEVFKGYKTEISADEFKKLIKQNSASIITQTMDFAFADRILYELRSKTGTVDSMPLIASSIMSKKIACGAKVIVLDVKYGNGAFMKTLKDAKKLAKTMVEIGKKAGLKVCAIISNMRQPLTKYIGNNLEVYSALQVLNGEQNKLYDISVAICEKALMLIDKNISKNDARVKILNAIKSGEAKTKLIDIVSSQGGATECIINNDLLLPKNNTIEIFSSSSGYVYEVDTAKLGYLVHDMQKVCGKIIRQDDVGIILSKSLGDKVKKGELLLTAYYNELDDLKNIELQLNSIYKIGRKPIAKKLIECVIN